MDTTNDVILCACGCGQPVKKAKYPSQQKRFINTHQHKGANNGNYRGGKEKRCCPVCNQTFEAWKSEYHVTCSDKCYIEWQRMTTAARGANKVKVNCAYCGKEIRLFPSQVKERNYCNKYCLAKGNPKAGGSNGNWRGGRKEYFKDQAMLRDNYRCVICGFDVSVDIHHITPRTQGGTNDFSNLITLCPNHHRMADLGIISVEHLRNFDWQPVDTVDTSIPPVSNRSHK